MIFRNYLHENGEAVKLLAIDMPDKTFANFLEPLEAAMEHEKYVTSLINDIYTAALEAHDYRRPELPRLVHRRAAGGRGQRRHHDHQHEAVRAATRRACTTWIRPAPPASTPCRAPWPASRPPSLPPLERILLHACCGPCSLEPVRHFALGRGGTVVFYANSNIHPAEEYARRLATLREWAADADVEVVEGAYDPEAWEATAGRIGDAAEAKFGVIANEEGDLEEEALFGGKSR